MEQNNQKIKSFTDLRVWQQAHKFVLHVYKLTKKFPKEEMFGLTAQLRRAAVSVTSNIAEGFCRNGAKDKIHFYNIALASLIECENQLLLGRDLSYITEQEFNAIQMEIIPIAKMLNALMSAVRSKAPHPNY